MVTRPLHARSGFTLIEMSIVVVIIGLLIGAVLVGRDLYQTAMFRKTISDMDSFTAATHTFKNKYGCLPGDCLPSVATDFGLSPHPNLNVVNNGDNNGKVCTRAADNSAVISVAASRYECRNYWYHLSQTNLIKWNTSDVNSECFTSVIRYGLATPPLPFYQVAAGTDIMCAGWLIVGPGEMNIGAWPINNPNHAFLMMGGFRNVVAVAAGAQVDVNYSPSLLLSPTDAMWFDTKLDDGRPNTGRVRAIGLYQDVSEPPANRDLTAPFRGNAGLWVCINESVTPNIYNATISAKACNLMLDAGF